MSKFYSYEADNFVQWIHDKITNGGYFLLHCKDYEQAEQCNERLLGYYDSKGFYIIPDRLFILAEDFLSENRLTFKRLELELYLSGYIRNENDGVKVRYRRQKRIGKTNKRYLTFLPTALFNKEEREKMFM